MGRKNTACKVCKSIKSRCSKEQPCARCKRLSLSCSYESSSGLAARGSARAARHLTKVKHAKTATGCLNCRQRRRKCDETKPTCGDCERLGLSCVLPPEARSSPSQGPGSPPYMTDSFLASDAFVQWTQTGPAGEFRSASRVAVFSDCLTLIETDHRMHTAKTGRLAGSTALASLGLPCADDDELGLATFLPSTALNNLTGVTHQALRTWSIPERHLLNHFLQSVSRALVVVEDRHNPFLRVMVPMALENPMVRHSLTALSACHLSKAYPDFEQDLSVHRSKALEMLMAELDSLGDPVWALASTLLLCLVEVSSSITMP